MKKKQEKINSNLLEVNTKNRAIYLGWYFGVIVVVVF